MNLGTINTITSVLGMLNPALGVIGNLIGSIGGGNVAAKFAKVSGQVQDAASVVSSLAPLLQQFAEGGEVTPEDVRAALADKDEALAKFDRLIAQKGG